MTSSTTTARTAPAVADIRTLSERSARYEREEQLLAGRSDWGVAELIDRLLLPVLTGELPLVPDDPTLVALAKTAFWRLAQSQTAQQKGSEVAR